MSVVPSRPQSGETSQTNPNEGNNGADFNTTDLPPTLFSLPNLKSGSFIEKIDRAKAQKQSDEEGRGEIPNPAPIAQPESSTEKSIPAEKKEHRENQTERVESSPAGRTWMEQIGSHALVIAMLMIFVAAAFLTGDDSPDKRDEIASQNDSKISFDDSVNLPLPSHEHDGSEIDLASGSENSDEVHVALNPPLSDDTASSEIGLDRDHLESPIGSRDQLIATAVSTPLESDLTFPIAADGSNDPISAAAESPSIGPELTATPFDIDLTPHLIELIRKSDSTALTTNPQ